MATILTTRGARAARTSLLLLVLFDLAGCWRTQATPFVEGDDAGTDSESPTDGECPYDCASIEICEAADGVVLLDYECAKPNQVCCDWIVPCPYDCISPAICGGVDGTVHEELWCEDPQDVCCDWIDWCTYECASQEACEGVGGTVVEELVCEDTDDVCCDWVDDTDTGTGSDMPICPLECLVEPYCNTIEGVVHDGYDCPGTTICCET